MNTYTVKQLNTYAERTDSQNLWAVVNQHGKQVGMYMSRDYAESVARELNQNARIESWRQKLASPELA